MGIVGVTWEVVEVADDDNFDDDDYDDDDGGGGGGGFDKERQAASDDNFPIHVILCYSCPLYQSMLHRTQNENGHIGQWWRR